MYRYLVPQAKLISVLALLHIVFLPKGVLAIPFRTQLGVMAPRTTLTNNDESAVMRELKEKIQSQAAEIERLQKKFSTSKAKKVVSAGHSGHGGDAEHDDVHDYMERTVLQLAMHRISWLSLFLCSLSFTAVIMNRFENTLSKQIELAYFVPLLAGHGGNTGGQTVGTVLSALSSGSIKPSDAPRVIAKEASSGFMIGSILGLLVGPIIHYVMGISLHVSTVVTCTLPLTSTIAATLGSSIPFLCNFIGVDPAIVSAPAMTSFVDVSGLLAYFLIAKEIFYLFGVDL